MIIRARRPTRSPPRSSCPSIWRSNRSCRSFYGPRAGRRAACSRKPRLVRRQREHARSASRPDDEAKKFVELAGARRARAEDRRRGERTRAQWTLQMSDRLLRRRSDNASRQAWRASQQLMALGQSAKQFRSRILLPDGRGRAARWAQAVPARSRAGTGNDPRHAGIGKTFFDALA